jgi:transcriptional regulator with XRE-family HTH domain
MTNLTNSPRRLELVAVDGSVLRRARKAAGMTGAELGKFAGVSMATISRLETGVTSVAKPATLRAIAGVLFATGGKTSAARVGLAVLTRDEVRREEVAS